MYSIYPHCILFIITTEVIMNNKKMIICICVVLLLSVAILPIFAQRGGFNHNQNAPRQTNRQDTAQSWGHNYPNCINHNGTQGGTHHRGMGGGYGTSQAAVIGIVKSVDTKNNTIEITNADNKVIKAVLNPLTMIYSLTAAQTTNTLASPDAPVIGTINDIKTGDWVQVHAINGTTENLDVRSIMIMKK